MPPQVSALLLPVVIYWKCFNSCTKANLRLFTLGSCLALGFFKIIFCLRYECEESFTTLNVDIRNHQNLLDSMEQYVKGDLLEGANAYHCEKCNKKVRTECPFVCQTILDFDNKTVFTTWFINIPTWS